eukprot:s1232_g16.t1
MVLRRNRADGGLFFGCSQFAQGRCRGAPGSLRRSEIPSASAVPLPAANTSERKSKEFSPTGVAEFSLMVGSTGGMHENDQNLQMPSGSDGVPAAQAENSEFDEWKVALLDTACTACMHSRSWRVHYEKTLPPNAGCQPTPLRKTFHFANGASSADKLVVWKIPIFLEVIKARFTVQKFQKETHLCCYP